MNEAQRGVVWRRNTHRAAGPLTGVARAARTAASTRCTASAAGLAIATPAARRAEITCHVDEAHAGIAEISGRFLRAIEPELCRQR